MEQLQHKKFGVLIMALGTVTMFLLFGLFHLNGKSVDYSDTGLLLKMFLVSAIPIVSLFGGLYFYVGRKIALQVSGGLAVLMIVCYLLGFLLH